MEIKCIKGQIKHGAYRHMLVHLHPLSAFTIFYLPFRTSLASEQLLDPAVQQKIRMGILRLF